MDEMIMGIPSAWKGHEDFAVWLVKKLKPEVIVDLGVNRGFSSFVFASCKTGKVYAIDWFKGGDFMLYKGYFNENIYNYVKRIENNLKKRGIIKDFELIKGDFTEVSNTWDKKIDILHIDGSHHYEDIKRDFTNWKRFVKDDGVILIHDVYILDRVKFDGVYKFFNEIDQYNKCMFKHSHGLGVVSKSKQLIELIKKKWNIE